MTPEELRSAAAILLAAADGKAVRSSLGTEIPQTMLWDITPSHLATFEIKPTPKLRPWTAEEAIGKVVKHKTGVGYWKVITSAYECGVTVEEMDEIRPYATLLEEWTQLDGSPCGVEVVE